MKKLWNYLSGKKTYIGIGLHAAWFIANLAFKDIATTEEVITGHALIGTITGVGVGHKIAKSKINSAIDKANGNNL